MHLSRRFGRGSATRRIGRCSSAILATGRKRWSTARAARVRRGCLVIAVGGGTVGDLAGFAAWVWLRGVRLLAVPTTLLAMVDSSVGGKTGVNGVRSKNAIGTFWPPSAVVADMACLETLPAMSYRDAFAEVVKYGVAMDRGIFELLQKER